MTTLPLLDKSNIFPFGGVKNIVYIDKVLFKLMDNELSYSVTKGFPDGSRVTNFFVIRNGDMIIYNVKNETI